MTQNSADTFWLSDPTSVWWLKAADFWFGAAGFFLTIITLVVAVKARQAALDAKIRVKRYDAAAGSQNAIFIVEGVFAASDRADWSGINKHLAEVRQIVISVSLAIDQEQKLHNELKKAAKVLQKTISNLDAAHSGRVDYPDVVEFKLNLRKLEDTLREANRNLQEKIV